MFSGTLPFSAANTSGSRFLHNFPYLYPVKHVLPMNKLLLLSLFCIVCALPVGAHAANPSAEYPAAGENGHPLPRRQADAALRAAVRQYLSE